MQVSIKGSLRCQAQFDRLVCRLADWVPWQ